MLSNGQKFQIHWDLQSMQMAGGLHLNLMPRLARDLIACQITVQTAALMSGKNRP